MRKYPLLIVISLILLYSCNQEDSISQTISKEEYVQSEGTVLTGRLRIKLEDEIIDTKAIPEVLSELNVTSVSRTFPFCGRFEKRTREEGLHLWYDIAFDPSISITKASNDISKKPGVVHVEYIQNMIATNTYPFNDPYLQNQWHYNNTGQTWGYVAGADINLFKAWEINTGSQNVIVAVCDQGVMYNHEDLKDNMWINEKEYNGIPSIDDDGNGFVDDIYGYNFCVSDRSYVGTIIPGDHGTHVAGTIGAVNNNGKGYCGVAGGNGTSKGVRIMSCQILKGDANPGAAIKYGADNGAVISNNSWRSNSEKREIEQSMKEAIDYFNKYAGMDENGLQEGPMAGGLVIFSAGNENTDWCYPAMYDGVMAVAAIGANFKKSSFSNYGQWVDISAPGGDGNDPASYVWSPFVDNKYGGMAGTSQAAPHVAGVAALVVSEFGGKGFMRERLWDILINGVRNIDQYNSNYIGLIGSGLIDAYKCLIQTDPNPPSPVERIWTNAISNTINLKWLVPVDDSGKAAYFDVYSSKISLEDLDITKSLPSHVSKTTIKTGSVSAGDTVRCSLNDMDFNTKYYIRIDSFDNSGNHSGLSAQVSQQTYTNHSPVIIPKTGNTLIAKSFETKELRFTIIDPDGHDITVEFTPGSNAASLVVEDNEAIVSVVGNKAPEGTYTASFKVSDKYNGSATQTVIYTLLPNVAPRVIADIPNILLKEKGEPYTIDLSDYITDDDGEALSYEIASSSTASIVETAITGDILSIKGKYFEKVTLKVTAFDAMKKSCSLSFDVLLRDNSQEIDIFPNPVSDILYLRTSNENNAQVTIFSTSGAKVINQEVPIGPFSNGKIDVSTLSTGTYTVIISFEGKEIKRNIVKL